MGIVRGKHHLEHALPSDHLIITSLMSSVSRLLGQAKSNMLVWAMDDEKAKSGYSEAQLVPQTSWGGERMVSSR